MGKIFLDESGFLHKNRPLNKNLIVLDRELTEPDYFTDTELYEAKGSVLVFDIEIFPNYFLVAFKHYTNNKVVTFELYPGREVFNNHKLLWTIHNNCIIGFNSNKFDIPLLNLALQGGSIEQIAEATEKIIKFGAQPRDIEEFYKFKPISFNTIDLIEVAPLSASLKAYMARLHAPRLQELPYEPTKYLSEVEAHKVKMYCVNDLDGTALLCRELEPQLELRAAMSAEYKMDLRSKSDAQIAEAVICSEVAKLNGKYPKRPKIEAGYTFKYQVPEFLRFKTPVLQQTLELVRNTSFTVEANGKISNTSDLENYTVKIGKSVYRMGIGGLHSSEEKVVYKADEEHYLLDRDVNSYYPNIILNQKLYPKHMGVAFLEVYQEIVTSRLNAKKQVGVINEQLELSKAECEDILKQLFALLVMYTTTTNSKKTVVNGSFGKLNSKYSALYAPDLLIQVTVSGQLCLLLLIEMIELAVLSVVSGNTDGIVIKCPTERYNELNAIIKEWEMITGFETEETRYKELLICNVNNYIAVKPDGKVKLKGAYSKAGLSKNPVCGICVDAAINYIVDGKPIEETIKECKEISKFVTVRTVKGGAYKDYDIHIPEHNSKEELVKQAGYYQWYGEDSWKLQGSSDMGISTLDSAYQHAKVILSKPGLSVYLGKLVRFYYSKGCTGNINYVLSGNKVPKSEGGRPVLDLPPVFPEDVNFERYIEEATNILYDVGFLQTSVQESFF